ncbi:pro-sigmaK processing inhibitor BofA family protein [Alkalicoccobacillus plakortidis]|uniref:Pro-sigmaK processing inhibitor BofA family protein n=1 Tax=Alkalicoccobacillus plakortidis TaxID=444060 RepID=A0ABT0XKP7_9BACI|nr:pro-sigmaK processing inhibitor BofA family protein [Alkalicoccobacillus plakortidis]MCM2676479.1 pro-sigmaK processing inhibitor BofA family protein [Alkalicoccobacillus plakortidis]
MDPIILFALLGGAVILLLTVGAPMRPIRLVGNIAVKLVIGLLLLFLVNASGSWTGLHVPINPVTASVTGLLGVPGLVLLVVVKQFVL